MSTTSEPTNSLSWRIPDTLRRQIRALLSADALSGETLTYEEFLEWADEDTLAEWVDGRIVMASPASRRHQKIANFLVGVFGSFVELHQLGEILDGPFQMKLARTGREPDALFVATAHLDRLQKTYLDGAADLVVEIISPESAGRDRGDTFYEYQEASIPEYWLIDPDREHAEFYQLDAQGVYQLVAPDSTGVYRSSALSGFWLNVAWLWREPLPTVERAMLAIDEPAYTRYLERLRQQDPLI